MWRRAETILFLRVISIKNNFFPNQNNNAIIIKSTLRNKMTPKFKLINKQNWIDEFHFGFYIVMR